jgi:hypothetical protein
MNSTEFRQLNSGWNAEPNAPDPKIRISSGNLVLSFELNAFQYPQFSEGQVGHLRFRNVRRFRIGQTNDEGWYAGQCRFSGLAPKWGEFYEVTGDLKLEKCSSAWIEVENTIQATHHYLFYFRDSTFECDAESYEFHPFAPPAYPQHALGRCRYAASPVMLAVRCSNCDSTKN